MLPAVLVGSSWIVPVTIDLGCPKALLVLWGSLDKVAESLWQSCVEPVVDLLTFRVALSFT